MVHYSQQWLPLNTIFILYRSSGDSRDLRWERAAYAVYAAGDGLETGVYNATGNLSLGQNRSGASIGKTMFLAGCWRIVVESGQVSPRDFAGATVPFFHATGIVNLRDL
jgi:hypothetical protein